MNGKYGFTVWKNAGVTSIGKVPPEPATCITKSIIPTALPIFPNTDTREYTIQVNTILVNIEPNTSNGGFTALTPSMYISPTLTISACIIAIVRNVSPLPKYTS